MLELRVHVLGLGLRALLHALEVRLAVFEEGLAVALALHDVLLLLVRRLNCRNKRLSLRRTGRWTRLWSRGSRGALLSWGYAKDG